MAKGKRDGSNKKDRTQKKAVFVLSNLAGSSATMIADGVYRMIHGQKVKIGLWLDDNSLMDFICCIACLLELYLLFRLLNRKKAISKKLWKGVVSGIVAVLLLVFPYLLHYNYTFFTVWLPPSLFPALFGVEICCLLFSYQHIVNHKNK